MPGAATLLTPAFDTAIFRCYAFRSLVYYVFRLSLPLRYCCWHAIRLRHATCRHFDYLSRVTRRYHRYALRYTTLRRHVVAITDTLPPSMPIFRAYRAARAPAIFLCWRAHTRYECFTAFTPPAMLIFADVAIFMPRQLYVAATLFDALPPLLRGVMRGAAFSMSFSATPLIVLMPPFRRFCFSMALC